MPDRPLDRVTDSRRMKALSHPVRVALLHELGLRSELTATEAAEVLGTTPTTCSFHLRQLESYGFVERAGDAGRRAQPWRLKSQSLHLDIDDGSDLEGRVASAVGEAFMSRQLEAFTGWLTDRSEWPREWRDASDQSQYVMWVTAQELQELVNDLRVLLSRYRDRLDDPSRRPEGARPVQALSYVNPLGPPPPHE